eukprot:gene19202-27202_t
MRDRGQRIWIRLDRSEPGTAHEPASAPLGHLRLRISDEGEGMPPEVRQKIFEPFFTTKELGRGTGLGMSTVYGFVKQSRGSIRLRTAPGEGTAVILYLPRVTGAVELEGPASAPAEGVPPGLQVMLVEDDPEV